LAPFNRACSVQAGSNYFQDQALWSAGLPSRGPTRLPTYKNAAVLHCTPASTTTSTHFSCILCLHCHCTYRVELTLCKHSIFWQFR